MVQDELQTSSEEEPRKHTRWNPNEAYDTKPLDPDYFKKYYQNKLKTPFTCPDCGKTISNKTNLSKHQKVQKLSKLMLKLELQPQSKQDLPTLNRKTTYRNIKYI